MRAALWVLTLFALAVGFTLAARLDQGYVIVVFPPWRMELSFMLALFMLVGLMMVVYVLSRLMSIALNLSGDVRAWRERNRRIKADQTLFQALRAYIDGDSVKARQLAEKASGCQAPDLAQRLARPHEERSHGSHGLGGVDLP
jgi:HemY protein